MSILQRFFLRRVLSAFLVTLIFLLGLLCMIESFELRNHLAFDAAATRQLAAFLVLRLPAHVYLILPLALMLAVIFVTALLALASETTAVRAAGVGLLRWTGPLHLFTLLLAILAFLGSEFFVADAAARADRIRRVEIQGRAPVRAELADLVVSHDGGYILAERYHPAEGILHGVVLIVPAPEHDAADLMRHWPQLRFDGARWLSDEAGDETGLERLPSPVLLELQAARSAVRILRGRPIETVRLSELLREIREMRGLLRLGPGYADFAAEIAVRRVRLHSKLAFPATLPPLIVLAVYLGARAGRRRSFGRVVADAVFHSLGYMLLLQMSLRLGEMAARLDAVSAAAPFIPWLTPALLALLAGRRRRLD